MNKFILQQIIASFIVCVLLVYVTIIDFALENVFVDILMVTISLLCIILMTVDIIHEIDNNKKK